MVGCDDGAGWLRLRATDGLPEIPETGEWCDVWYVWYIHNYLGKYFNVKSTYSSSLLGVQQLASPLPLPNLGRAVKEAGNFVNTSPVPNRVHAAGDSRAEV